MRIRFGIVSAVALVGVATLAAQPPPRRAERPGPPPGKWWERPEMVEKLKITPDQQKKLDEVFQQSRSKLIDLHAALDKEEGLLDPLMKAQSPDDSKILPEIDRIAQARVELEKAEARLLLGMRHVLTLEQWRLLEVERPNPPPGERPPPPQRHPE